MNETKSRDKSKVHSTFSAAAGAREEPDCVLRTVSTLDVNGFLCTLAVNPLVDTSDSSVLKRVVAELRARHGKLILAAHLYVYIPPTHLIYHIYSILLLLWSLAYSSSTCTCTGLCKRSGSTLILTRSPLPGTVMVIVIERRTASRRTVVVVAREALRRGPRRRGAPRGPGRTRTTSICRAGRRGERSRR